MKKGEVTTDKDYIEAFNQGYELSKELGLKPKILDGTNIRNERVQAIYEGMEQFQRELSLEKGKSKIPPSENDEIQRTTRLDSIRRKNKEMGKGLDLDI